MTTTWARWVRRSRPAEASKGAPNKSGHSSKARLLVSIMLDREHEKGIKVSDKEMAALNLEQRRVCPN